MEFSPDIRADLHYEAPDDARGRIAGGVLAAVAHAALMVALLLTGQTATKMLTPAMTVTLLPEPPKPPPAPPGPQFIAPQAIETAAPEFSIAVTPETPGSSIAGTTAAVVPPKPAPIVIASPDAGPVPMDDLRAYYAKVVRYLEARVHTPARIGREGRQPTATVHVISDRNGHVQLAELYISSGYSDLDEEAVDVVKRSDPLPPMPPDTRADHIDINIPVLFRFGENTQLVH